MFKIHLDDSDLDGFDLDGDMSLDQREANFSYMNWGWNHIPEMKTAAPADEYITIDVAAKYADNKPLDFS